MHRKPSLFSTFLLLLLAGTTLTATGNAAAQDTTSPNAVLSSPGNDSTVTGTVTIGANATDNVGVARVRFYAREGISGNSPTILLAEDTAAPFAITRDTSAIPSGRVYQVAAMAYDAAGNQGFSGITTVTIDHLDGTRPTVTITAPVAGATISGITRFAASATDDQAIASAGFYTRGKMGLQPFGWREVPPYEFMASTFGVPDGSHVVYAQAIDTGGTKSAMAGPISVIVDNRVAEGRLRVDDANSAVVYTGWGTVTDDEGLQGRIFHWNAAHISGSPGANARFTFTGTGVRWLGISCWQCGVAHVAIDGGAPTPVFVDGTEELDSPRQSMSRVLYTSPALPYGVHTIDITVGSEWKPIHGPFVIVDGFEVLNP